MVLSGKSTTLIVRTAIIGVSLSAAVAAFSQNRNNPFSPSPQSIHQVSKPEQTRNEVITGIVIIPGIGGPNVREMPMSAPMDNPKPASVGNTRKPDVTEIYKIAVGDVLIVNLKNSPQGTGFYTVRNDGSIEYPLAGGIVQAAGRSAEEISAALAAAIKLFQVPQVDVKVHQYLSHTVIVSGQVNNPGEKYLRREAMPLYVLRAESDVKREAKLVRILRFGSKRPMVYDLSDRNTDGMLVYPGDSLEFVADQTAKLKL